MALKTLNDFINDEIPIYPSFVDEVTKSTIQDWFGYRKVASNKYFANWFYRTLMRDYPRYQELLRIEARTSGSAYDWLVTNYEERQVETQGNDTTSENKSLTTNRSNNRTFTAGTREVTVDNSTDETDGSVTTKHTGTDENKLTRNLNHSDSERFIKDAQGVNDSVRTPNLRTVTTGSDETDQTGNTSTNRTPDLTTENKTSGSDSSRHGALQRQAPYDSDYPGLSGGTNSNVYHTVGENGVDANNPELINESGYMAGFPTLVISNPTAASDEVTSNSNVNYNKVHESGSDLTIGSTALNTQTDRNETRSETGTDTTRITTSDNEDNTTTRNGSDTGTENNVKTLDLTDTDETDTTNTHEGRSETTRSGSDLDVTVSTGNDSGNTNTTATRKNLERTIYTGRTGQSPQMLLSEAVEFIKSTSAWLWLYRQIDKCFLMAYDISEYEEEVYL